MLNNFLKWSTGKTNIKVISIILAITLTFANFAILGSYLTESIARDNVSGNSETENIEFTAYLEDKEGGNKVNLSADINSEDVNINFSVKVKNGGVLTNASIELEQTNFKIKNQEDLNRIDVGILQSGQSFNKKINVVSIKDEEYNLNLLNMESSIKLVGTYKDNNGNESNVSITKNIIINWNTKDINEENNPIKLTQNLITNKIYKINGEEKRVLQLEVVSGIENNSYPIKNTKIELNIPKLQNNEIPEKVVVVSYGTNATNGDSGINFIKEYTEEIEGEEIVKGNWKFDKENKKTVIHVENNETEENKIISWKGNAEDKFIITYIYDKDTDISNIESNINSEINLYGNLNQKLTKTSTITIGNPAEQGEGIVQELNASKKIYKGNINLGKDTDYLVMSTIKIGYSEIGNEIIIKNEKDKIKFTEGEDKEAETYYKEVTINKDELLNIIGEDGALKVSIINEENKKEVIDVIDKETKTDEEGNIVLDYNSYIYEDLIISISPIIKEGQINILSRKGISVSGLKEEEIAKIEKIIVNSVMEIKQGEEEIITNKEEKEIEIEKPKTEVEIGIDNTNLSTTQENNINITAVLKNNNIKYDLYKDPEVKIILPKEIKNIEIVGNPDILNASNLELENYEIIENEGNKVIKLVLKGEQLGYTRSNTKILINAKVKTDELLPTLKREIKLECKNGKETEYENNELKQAESKVDITLKAEEGILIANKISNYNEEQKEIMAFKDQNKSITLEKDNQNESTLKGIIINNTNKDLTNLEIKGKINGTIKTPISVENGEVYYTKNSEVGIGTTWSNEFIEGAKGYRIVIEELKNKEIIEFSYNMIILKENNQIEFQVTSNGEIANSPIISIITEEDNPQEDDNPPIDINPQEDDNPPIDIDPADYENMQELNDGINFDGIKKVSSDKVVAIKATSNPGTTSKLETGEIVTVDIEISNLIEGATKTIITNFGGEEEELELIKTSKLILSGNITYGLIAKQAIIITGNRSQTLDLNNSRNFTINGFLNCEDTVTVQLKLEVEENIPVRTFCELSAKLSIPGDDTGPSTEVEYGETVYTSLLYRYEDEKNTIKVKAPEKIELKVGETKGINLEIEPSEKSIEDLDIFIEDKEIASLDANKNIIGKKEGKTYLIINTKVGKPLAKTEIIVKNEQEEGPVSNDSTYSISGFAWLDENENGKMDSTESPMTGIKVKIKDNSTGEYVKDEKGEIIVKNTDMVGSYKFNNLKSGDYSVEFDYNKNQFKLTPITNKDSSAHIVTEGNITYITTNSIKLQNKDIENINIGLVLNNKFDLELNKYVKKITVQNSKGTNTYEFDNSKLAKIDIKAKELEGSVVIVEYLIEVKNNGKVPGYAKNIVDYVSPGYKYSSEMNTEWYEGNDGNLYCSSLANTIINPGETKTLKLTLTKTMTNSNAGLVNNSAEIYEDFNEYVIQDINSSPANGNEKENDFSSADVIISIATGGVQLYITIVILSMILLSAGVYLINKKILKAEIQNVRKGE